MNPKPLLRRAAALSFLAVFTGASLAHAHPGHDGHELTWDFTHLAEYPLATATCFAVLAGSSWLLWRLLRRANHNFRGSQASRGK